MASSSKLNRDNGCFKFKANRPHFFKVILQQTIDDGKLVSVPFVFCYFANLA